MSAGDALHYGQKLRVVANPMVQGEVLDGIGGSRPLYLYSRPVGTTHFAKYSRHQLVAFTDRPSYDSVWQVVALIWKQEAYFPCGPALLLLPSLMSCIRSDQACMQQSGNSFYPMQPTCSCMLEHLT